MIKIRIRNDDHEIDLQFPISENKLYAKLAEIHAIEGKDAPQSAFVTEVYWPEELSMLKDRFANLDELNYLARRMESFDYHEYDQFLIGITKLENPTEKDLINLTFNLDHFTLCKDVSSYGKIGREYVMNTEGAVPAHDEDDPKYAAIGKALIDRGLAQITAKGLLIYNPFDELTEVYDGQTFPNTTMRIPLPAQRSAITAVPSCSCSPVKNLQSRRRLPGSALLPTATARSGSVSVRERMTPGRNASKASSALKDCMRRTKCFAFWTPAIWIGAS